MEKLPEVPAIIGKEPELNGEALELFSTLNSLNIEAIKGTHLEIARSRTLRNMKKWAEEHNEKMNDFRDTNCATKDVDGKKILLKTTVKVSRKNEKGEEVTEEQQVNEYTPEGSAKMKSDIKDYNKKKITVKFTIFNTYDDGGDALSEYQKEVLREHKFLITKEEFDSKIEKKTETIEGTKAHSENEGDKNLSESTDGKSA